MCIDNSSNVRCSYFLRRDKASNSVKMSKNRSMKFFRKSHKKRNTPKRSTMSGRIVTFSEVIYLHFNTQPEVVAGLLSISRYRFPIAYSSMMITSVLQVVNALDASWLLKLFRLGLAPIKGPCHSSTERSLEIFCCPECFRWRFYGILERTWWII